MTDNSAPRPAKLFDTVFVKLIGVIAAIALLTGIYFEARIAYRMTLGVTAASNGDTNSVTSSPAPAAPVTVTVAGSSDADADFKAFEKRKIDAEAASAAAASAAQAQLCDQRFQAILDAKSDALAGQIGAFQAVCKLTEDQRGALKAALARPKDIAAGDTSGTSPTAPQALTPTDEPVQSGAAASPVEAPAAAREPAAVAFKTFVNADMYGGDISVLKDLDHDACDAACRNETRCVAYSYDSWNRSCYPKSAVNDLLTDARSMTAVKDGVALPSHSRNPVVFETFHNRAFPHQFGNQVVAQSLEGCEARCSNSDFLRRRDLLQSPACLRTLRHDGEVWRKHRQRERGEAAIF